MKIASLYGKGRAVFSFEVFPPKKTHSIETIYTTLEQLQHLRPDFISVTYGAGGNVADTKTREIAATIKHQYGIPAMAHLTCVNCTREEADLILQDFAAAGIDNILALRGDRNPDLPPKTDFTYAADLVSYIRERGDFGISAACYPEGHPESDNIVEDILHLKEKVDRGVDTLITQLFFDNNLFYSFLERARIAGIKVPISAGIMPVTNKKQIERMVTLCGASLPPKFTKMMQRYESKPEALADAGIAYAIDQIIDLLSNGVDGIHLYTMNNPTVAKKVSDSIRNLL